MRLLLILLFAPIVANGQQPFITDDADIAPQRHFHLELLNEYDLLQTTSYPAVRQNTTRFQLTFGLTDKMEVGLDAPLISINNATLSGTPNAFGVGDLDFQTKYRIRTERAGSHWPALTVSMFIEVPTGNPRNQLGSGLADYWLNGIVQKELTSRITYRLNSGILFSGNTLTGAVGVRSTHGFVYTGSSSLTVKLTERWLVGGEVAGALTRQFELQKGQLQVLLGGKCALTKSIGLDFAATGGKFEGSPRAGATFGISIDF
jgi:hypothetical protein